MAVTNKVYTKACADAFGSSGAGNAPNIDWLSDDIRVMLVNGYTFDQNAHEFLSSVRASEIANGNGYTTNGQALASKTLASASLVSTFDAADPSWAGSTFSVTGAVIYDNTPATDATKPLIAYIDFGATQSPSAATFSIVFNASGIFTITVS